MTGLRYSGIVLLAVFALASCDSETRAAADEADVFASNHGQSGVKDDVSDANILQIAIGSDDHSTLVAAVQAAELEDVLVNPGPLTVFAPNNAAFEKLPPGTVEDLLKPENKSSLRSIITGHASPGTYAGDLLKDGSQLYMATGHYVDVEVREDGTYVNGSKILATVDASNGVVHVIEDVFIF
ncbi:MAG: fasciclin domain-containing protein [Gemmatimonadetes bacterium]|nr:fasciclin domain-containing protein [Gemmatimonadota bacterium]